MSSATEFAPAAKRISTWSLHLSALVLALIALGIFYAPAIAAAVTVWWVSPTFSHCFLIIPVSAYLIWNKRDELAVLSPAAYAPALLLAPLVIVAAFLGELASINEIEQLAVVAFAQILIWALLGGAVYRAILFPCLYLFFLVPMGEYLIAPLQHFTTWFIDHGLNILGILHYTEGNLIELANGKFQVAEACAGLRFLIATVAVGALFSYLTYNTPRKIFLFMLASVIVPIIGNGFRALGIVLLAHFSDNRIAVGADHLVYGWGFSVAILAVLMYVGLKFADEMPGAAPVLPCALKSSPLVPVLLTAVLAMALVPGFAVWRAEAAVPVNTNAFALPPSFAEWQVSAVTRDWAPQYQSPDARLEFSLWKPETPPVSVHTEYYGDGGRHLISSANKMWDEEIWHPISQSTANASIGGKPIEFRELVLGSGGVSRLIWWSYVSGGDYTTSAFAVKLNRMRSAISGGEGAALLALSTPVEGDLDTARKRLKDVATTLSPIKARIDHAR
ncbi:exosortase A [Rhizomicrobium palustre]|uniref:Exosortase A n=1 Tax=Rhizomicrobium palustre TaxID=189966 RepID=A0A846MU14_9PROT|nr:exosortase A [Rhizomicrobium palustre]NIK86701.1 exosortase A [Rhizomicrobium palustre]